MTEMTDPVRKAFADARTALERPRGEPPKRRPRPETDAPGDRALRAMRARHGFTKRRPV